MSDSKDQTTDQAREDHENGHTPQTESLAEDVPQSERVEDSQSDEEITKRLKRQGVRIGRGTIAPTVFGRLWFSSRW